MRKLQNLKNYERLSRLKFVIEEEIKKEKPKRKYTRKSKTEDKTVVAEKTIIEDKKDE